jgi:hypothetical protein
MMKYRVRVSYEYPVDALNAEDALNTVPLATRLKYMNSEGITEIFNSDGERVLIAVLEHNGSKGVYIKNVEAVTAQAGTKQDPGTPGRS